MRKTLVAAALTAGLAASFAPAPASAYCDATIYVLTGECANGCTIAASAYRRADATTRDRLPDVQFICYA